MQANLAQAPNRIGLMPAAGHARRLGKLACSKELLPVPSLAGEQPVCANLLHQFQLAGATRACIVSRHAKSDIPANLGHGEQFDLQLQYALLDHSPSVPHSIDAAYRHIKDCDVLFGFPDILIRPGDALTTLAHKREETGSDVLLGLFPSSQPAKVDMVDYDAEGRVRAIVIKDPSCRLRTTWLMAVWNPRFTDFLHQWVAASDSTGKAESQLGHIFSAASERGLIVRTWLFADGSYLDIGTPDDLEKARQGYWAC